MTQDAHRTKTDSQGCGYPGCLCSIPDCPCHAEHPKFDPVRDAVYLGSAGTTQEIVDDLRKWEGNMERQGHHGLALSLRRGADAILAVTEIRRWLVKHEREKNAEALAQLRALTTTVDTREVRAAIDALERP